MYETQQSIVTNIKLENDENTNENNVIIFINIIIYKYLCFIIMNKYS